MQRVSGAKSEDAQHLPSAGHIVMSMPAKNQTTDQSEKAQTHEVTIFDGKKLPDFSDSKIPFVWLVKDGVLQLCRK